MRIIEMYKNYLIERGYSQFTKSGNKSTVFAYASSVEAVCENENLSLKDLSENIKDIVKSYSIGGDKETEGERCHATTRNALKRFQEFVEE